MPSSERKEEEVHEMYERVEEHLDSETKGKDYTIVIVDINAVLGEGKEEKYTGNYGLRHRNQRGEKLMVEFCRRRQMSVSKIHGFAKTNEGGIHGQCLEIQDIPD